MISIITSIYNQLAMNRLYFESLVATTDVPWELIVIDNASTDGSRQFFQSLEGATHGQGMVHVIANGRNYSYPHCQNQGIEVAKGDVLAFLNNDIVLSRHWASRMLAEIGRDGYEVLTLSSNDRIADSATTRRLSRRWKHVKYPVIKLFGSGRRALRAMLRLTYGRWDDYAERVWLQYGSSKLIGFSGSAVLMTRRAIEMIGSWDPAQQGADFDLFLRTMDRAERVGDMRPMSVVNGVTHHHYRRLTFKSHFPPFADADNLSTIEQKWPDEQRQRYLAALEF